jgi:predicted nucleotidyltransferase
MTVNDEILKMTEVIKNTVPAERIYLFGSYAYGAPSKDCDYDFGILLYG